jgi:hypothetical protein
VSLSPPRKPNVGDVWVDPFDAARFIYTGTDKPYITKSGYHLDAFDGWERWDLRNEQYEYERDAGAPTEGGDDA